MLKKFAARMHTKEIIKYRGIGRHDSILEVGCNKGYLIAELMRFSDHVYGLDIDYGVVCMAKHQSHQVFVCDAENLALPECLFDAIISIHVIEHIENLAGALGEFARALKPNGTLILAYPYEPVVGVTCVPFAPLSGKCNVHLRALKPKNLVHLIADNRVDLRSVRHGSYYVPNPTYISTFKKVKKIRE